MVSIKVIGDSISFKYISKKALCDWCGKKYKWKELTSMVVDSVDEDGIKTYTAACICDKCNFKHDVV